MIGVKNNPNVMGSEIAGLKLALLNNPDYTSMVLRRLFSQLGQQLAVGRNDVMDAAAAANLPAESRLAALRGYNQKFNQYATNALSKTALGLSQQQQEALKYLLGLRQQEKLLDKQLEARQWENMFGVLNKSASEGAQALPFLFKFA